MTSAKPAKYFQSTDPDIVRHLKAGDLILKLTAFFDTETQTYFEKKKRYIVQYTPVHFAYSGNWAIRTTRSASLGERGGDKREEQYSETLYVNALCVHKYYFPESAVNLTQVAKSQDQLQSLLDFLNEPDFQFKA